MCKKQIEGDVAFHNACGDFCKPCKTIVHLRAQEAVRSNKQVSDGYCVWCGDEITNSNAQKNKDDENVCQPCSTKRDWLLQAIRLSDRPYKYVMRTEEREKPARTQRSAAIQQAAQVKPAQEQVIPSEQEARMRRLELMLNKLTSALGV